jgi:hypothetical protein
MNLKRIYKLAVFILIPLAVLSAFYEWKKFPISILLGGVLGLLNLKGLAWGLKDFATSLRPSGKVIFSSIARFFIMAFVLIILVIEKLVHPVGILIGFTVVFALILKEGLRIAKESSPK